MRGLSLRFPRFLRVREDKSIEQATTPQSLASMWKAQQISDRAKGGEGDDRELVDIDKQDSEISEHSDEVA